MALTLTEGAKLSNNVVLQGVVETIVKESPVLQALPFIEMSSNLLILDRVVTHLIELWLLRRVLRRSASRRPRCRHGRRPAGRAPATSRPTAHRSRRSPH